MQIAGVLTTPSRSQGRLSLRAFVACAAVLLTSALGASNASASTACSAIRAAGKTLNVDVVRGHTACGDAQAALGRFMSRHGVARGWRCRRASGNAGCFRGGRTYRVARQYIIATTAAPGPPLTKSQYESRLGPLLNNQVVPALRSALANGGANDPARVRRAIHALNVAEHAMAAVDPPAGVADLHRRAVVTLAYMVADATALRAAELRHNNGRKNAAASALRSDAREIQAVGSAMTRRGY